MGAQHSLEDLAEHRQACLVSLAVVSRSRSAATQHLISQFAAEDLAISVRTLVLEVLSDAAKELSNWTPAPTSSLPASPNNSVAGSSTSSTAGKTRRFASATKIPVSLPNHFSSELKRVLFPLLARWRQPDVGAARWAVGEPTLIGALLRCTGVLLECAGKACPDRDAAAAECVDLVEEFFSHREAHVRRCSVFLLSRVLLVGGEEAVLSKPLLLERAELAPLHEGDDICRNMLTGILTWLGQKALL